LEIARERQAMEEADGPVGRELCEKNRVGIVQGRGGQGFFLYFAPIFLKPDLKVYGQAKLNRGYATGSNQSRNSQQHHKGQKMVSAASYTPQPSDADYPGCAPMCRNQAYSFPT